MDAAVVSLRRLVLAAQARRQDFAAGLGIATGDTVLLSHLAAAGSLSPGELAQRAGIARSSATTAIDRLEQAGLAVRRTRPGDRRSLDIVLTEKGQRALARSDRETREALDRLGPTLLGQVAVQLNAVATALRS